MPVGQFFYFFKCDMIVLASGKLRNGPFEITSQNMFVELAPVGLALELGAYIPYHKFC